MILQEAIPGLIQVRSVIVLYDLPSCTEHRVAANLFGKDKLTKKVLSCVLSHTHTPSSFTAGVLMLLFWRNTLARGCGAYAPTLSSYSPTKVCT